MLYVCTTVSEYGLSREVDQILGVQLPLYMSQTPRYGCTPLRLDCVSLSLSLRVHNTNSHYIVVVVYGAKYYYYYFGRVS